MIFTFCKVDPSVNGYTKRFLKRKFNEWYANQITQQLAKGKNLEDVEVIMKLSLIKPIQAGWLVELYNHMTTEKGRDIISGGWRAAGITDAINLGVENLPSIDPFDDIDPLVAPENDNNCDQLLQAISNLTTEEITDRIATPLIMNNDAYDSDWEDPAQDED